MDERELENKLTELAHAAEVEAKIAQNKARSVADTMKMMENMLTFYKEIALRFSQFPPAKEKKTKWHNIKRRIKIIKVAVKKFLKAKQKERQRAIAVMRHKILMNEVELEYLELRIKLEEFKKLFGE